MRLPGAAAERALNSAHGSLRAAWIGARDLALAIPVVALALPLWLLPWSAAARLGRGYGRLVWHLWPLARRVALINLRRALGLDRRAARRLGWTAMAHLGESVADGLQCARRRGDTLERHVRLADPELAARILADPRPKVFVMAHLGSWEMGAAILARRFGERGGAIGRRIDNRFLDRLVRALRVARPDQWLEKRGGTAAALERLRAGDHVALLLDEDAGRRGTFVEFFGRPASTHRSAALLARMSGAQLVAGAVVRTEGSGERLFLLAEIEPHDGIGETTRRVTAVLEEWIRRHPRQWRWIHWRWRARPDGGQETYTRRDLEGAFASEERLAPRKRRRSDPARLEPTTER